MSIQLLVISRCKSDCGSFRDVNLTVARCTPGGLASNLQTVLATELYNDLNESLVKAINLPIFVFRNDEEDVVDAFSKIEPNGNRISL